MEYIKQSGKKYTFSLKNRACACVYEKKVVTLQAKTRNLYYYEKTIVVNNLCAGDGGVYADFR